MSDLPKQLRIKAGMMAMGEKIAWGSDTALMEQAADLIEQLQNERDALAATVEALKSIQGEDIIAFFNRQKQVFINAPTTNLAERDAAVARKAIKASAENYRKEHVGQSVTMLLNSFADIYAERVKRGDA
jgi:hypothetical protein